MILGVSPVGGLAPRGRWTATARQADGGGHGCLQEPSVSFLLKQLSTMRRFSSSNRSARVISRPPFVYAMPGGSFSLDSWNGRGRRAGRHCPCSLLAIRAARRMASGVEIRGRLVFHHSHVGHWRRVRGSSGCRGQRPQRLGRRIPGRQPSAPRGSSGRSTCHAATSGGRRKERARARPDRRSSASSSDRGRCEGRCWEAQMMIYGRLGYWACVAFVTFTRHYHPSYLLTLLALLLRGPCIPAFRGR